LEPRHLIAEHLIDDRCKPVRPAVGKSCDLVVHRQPRTAGDPLNLDIHHA